MTRRAPVSECPPEALTLLPKPSVRGQEVGDELFPYARRVAAADRQALCACAAPGAGEAAHSFHRRRERPASRAARDHREKAARGSFVSARARRSTRFLGVPQAIVNCSKNGPT